MYVLMFCIHACKTAHEKFRFRFSNGPWYVLINIYIIYIYIYKDNSWVHLFDEPLYLAN